MSRKHYFDLLKNRGFNSLVELNRLKDLLNTTYHYYFNFDMTLMNDINSLFLNYKNRGNFLTFNDLEEYVYSNSKDENEFLFNYTEMLLDINFEIVKPFLEELLEKDFERYMELVKHLEVLERQINDFLERSNHEIIVNGENRSIIVVRNVEATEAANALSDTDESIALKILEYNHFSNKGNTDIKRSILLDLYRYFEPKREKLKKHFEGDIFKGGSSPVIISRLFEMFNKLQIRHSKDPQYISTDDNKLLEKWYDSTYNTFLFVIISSKQLKISEDYIMLKENK